MNLASQQRQWKSTKPILGNSIKTKKKQYPHVVDGNERVQYNVIYGFYDFDDNRINKSDHHHHAPIIETRNKVFSHWSIQIINCELIFLICIWF